MSHEIYEGIRLYFEERPVAERAEVYRFMCECGDSFDGTGDAGQAWMWKHRKDNS